MFAYCGNEPVGNADYSGTLHCIATSCPQESQEDKRAALEQQKIIVRSKIIRAFRSKYAEELAVLEGKSSTYKGAHIIRVDSDGASFSCGVIFFPKDAPANMDYIRLLQHEYGHFLQLEKYGFPSYLCYVVIPSVTFFVIDSLGKLETNYYSLPWEYEADIYGGVTGRQEYERDASIMYIIYACIVEILRGNSYI